MNGQKLLWNLYAGVIGAAVAMVVNKLLNRAWQASTGAEPPALDDPDASATQAVIWATASAAGVAIATIAVNRFAASSWERVVGSPAPIRRG